MPIFRIPVGRFRFLSELQKTGPTVGIARL